MTPEEREAFPRRLKELLEGLGSSSAEVAAKLRLENCKGEIGVSYACPIARFLLRHQIELYVGHGYGIYTLLEPKQESQIFLPRPVSEFVREFDNRKYPDLEQSLTD